MDQVDYFLSKLRKMFGYFTVVRNPSTDVSWPAEPFIQLVAPVLWQEDRAGQLDLLFNKVAMFVLSVRRDAREFFLERASEEGICLDDNYPRAPAMI